VVDGMRQGAGPSVWQLGRSDNDDCLLEAVRKQLFAVISFMKSYHLPRQARDKNEAN
jgi:hypothetical protein